MARTLSLAITLECDLDHKMAAPTSPGSE